MFSGGIGVANNIYSGGNINSGDIPTTQYLTAANSTHMTIPSGTTAQRSVPTEGMVRFNTDYGHLEWYNGTSWTVGGFQDVTVSSSRTTLSWQTNWVQGNYTVTLPSAPARGDRVRFFLVSGPKHDCCKEW